MGFGYLLLGYLVTFLLKMIASALGVGFAALLVGYGLMAWGLHSLKRYCSFFAYAEWCLIPLFLLAIYRGAEELSELFLWNLPFVSQTVGSVVGWVEFAIIMLFHALLLSAIRELGMQVELNRIASAAVRNMIIVLIYAILYVLCLLPIAALNSVRQYFVLSLNLFNLAWIFCNLFLFLSCAKNICAEGQEDPEPKRYRWNFLNRVGDSFERNFQRASERSRNDVEDYLRKKQEKRANQEAAEEERRRKKYHHKKKK